MSNFTGYKTKAFSESQKFFVLDPNTGSPSFVQGSDLVKQLTPNSNYVFSESTRTTAQATDYAIGSLVQTAGATSAGDNFAAVYLVVAADEGDFPMDNGNELLVIAGDELLREQLAQNDAGDGSDLVAMAGTDDTVTEAINQRTIYVGSVAELEVLSLAEGVNVYLAGDGRAGEGVIKSGSHASDTQKGAFIDLANGNYWERLDLQYGKVYTSWFGASSEKADNINECQAASDFAKANGLKLIFNVECFVSEGLKVQVDCEFTEYLLTDEKYSNPALDFEDDSLESITDITGISGFTKGSVKLTGLTGRKGQTVSIKSSELLINRIGYANSYQKETTHFIVDDEGGIDPALPISYDPAQITSLQLRTSTPITVHGPLVKMINGVDGQNIDRNVFDCTRSNIEFIRPVMTNATDFNNPVRLGASIKDCYGVLVKEPKLDGFHYDTLGYPLLFTTTARTRVENIQARNSRKGVDSTFSNYLEIVGGTSDGPVGTHWGWNTYIDNVKVRPGPILAQAPFFAAGENFKMRNCKGAVANTSNPRLVAIRGDLLSIAGELSVKGCTLTSENCTGSARFVYLSPGAAGADYGVDTSLGDSIFIEDNTYDGTLPIEAYFYNDDDGLVNSVRLPSHMSVKKNFRDDGEDAGDIIFLVASVCASTTMFMDVENSHGIQTLIEDAGANIDLILRNSGNSKGESGSGATIRSTGGTLSKVHIVDSYIGRFWRAGFGGTAFQAEKDVLFENCRLRDGGGWSLQTYYRFIGCQFEDLITWSSVIPADHVIDSHRNRGVAQDFALDGVFKQY